MWIVGGIFRGRPFVIEGDDDRPASFDDREEAEAFVGSMPPNPIIGAAETVVLVDLEGGEAVRA